MTLYNTLIIGSGPAGYTAAIYAARANLKPLLIEGKMPGGQLMTTSDVENYPGFENAVTGPELMEVMKKQAARFGTEYLYGDVTRVDLSKKPFSIEVKDKKFQTKTLIIATGASALRLGLDSEKKYYGKGVSACATCDGYFFQDKEVLVVGGGDSAMEEALFLTKFCTKITVIHRRDALRASKIMQERAFKNPKMKFIWDSSVTEILGDGSKVTGARIKNLKTGKSADFSTDGVFVAIGHTPNTQLFAGQLGLDEKGYIKTKPYSTKTSIEGVFACGDVQDHVFRQAVTAAGTGCMAAIEAERYLEAAESGGR